MIQNLEKYLAIAANDEAFHTAEDLRVEARHFFRFDILDGKFVIERWTESLQGDRWVAVEEFKAIK